MKCSNRRKDAGKMQGKMQDRPGRAWRKRWRRDDADASEAILRAQRSCGSCKPGDPASAAILHSQAVDWIPHLWRGGGAVLRIRLLVHVEYGGGDSFFTPAATVAIAVTFLAVLWYKGIGKGRGRNRESRISNREIPDSRFQIPDSSSTSSGDNRVIVACLYFFCAFDRDRLHADDPLLRLDSLLPGRGPALAILDMRIIELFGFFATAATMDVVPGLLARVPLGAFLFAIMYFAQSTTRTQ